MANTKIDRAKLLIEKLRRLSPHDPDITSFEHQLAELEKSTEPIQKLKKEVEDKKKIITEKDIETIPIEEFAHDLIHNEGKVINMQRLKQEWEFIHQKENELKDSIWFKTISRRKGYKSYIHSIEKTSDKIAKLITFHDEYIQKAQKWARYLRTFENPMQPVKDRTYFDLSAKELKEYFDDPKKNLSMDKRHRKIKTMLKKDLSSHHYVNRQKFYKGVVLRLLNDYVKPIYKNMKEIKEFLSKIQRISGAAPEAPIEGNESE